jgi:hypothetical protein
VACGSTKARNTSDEIRYGRLVNDYLGINRANWDERAPAHADSPDCALASFAADPSHLSDVVRFDLPGSATFPV